MSKSPNCPTSEEWDRFLTDRSGKESSRLAGHLASCPFCRFAVAERSRELAEYGRILDEAAGIIRLSLVFFETDVTQSNVHLAAQGAVPPLTPESFTLSSGDNRLLLRAVKDARTSEIWLYLLSDDPALTQNVLVRPFAGEQEFVTDHLGRVNLGVLDWPSPEQQTAEIHLPSAVFVLSPYAGRTVDQASTVLSSAQGDQIRVTMSGLGDSRQIEIELLAMSTRTSDAPFRVAVRDVSSGQIKMVRSVSPTKARVGDMSAPDTIEIFLFQ